MAREVATIRAVLALFVAMGGCGRVEQFLASREGRALAAAHLDELRKVATEIEATCASLPREVSPAKGTAIDGRTEALEVAVSCRDPALGPRSLWRLHAALRGSQAPPNVSYYVIGVGKDVEAGVASEGHVEEYARVPSPMVSNATDLCIHRETTGVEICVAYATRN